MSKIGEPAITKPGMLRDFLSQENVLVHFDPRRADVAVPPDWKKNEGMALLVGYDLPVPIQHLAITDLDLIGVFSFNRTPYRCRIPWAAVYGIVGDATKRFRLWPDATVTRRINESLLDVEPAATETPATKRPSWFRGVLEGGKK